jgi:hypothetical protein
VDNKLGGVSCLLIGWISIYLLMFQVEFQVYHFRVRSKLYIGLMSDHRGGRVACFCLNELVHVHMSPPTQTFRLVGRFGRVF